MSGFGDDQDPYFPPRDEADEPEPTAVFGPRICWRRNDSDDDTADLPVTLWTGEVLLNNGRGVAGPFGVDPARAVSWAVSTALAMPAGDVCDVQLVEYFCAESWVAALIAEGEREYRRLKRFFVAPVRSGRVIPIAMPGAAP